MSATWLGYAGHRQMLPLRRSAISASVRPGAVAISAVTVTGPAFSVFGKERDGGADLAGRAVPALESIMAYERGLHRVQNALFGQTLDGGDLVAIMHHRECQTAVDALSVDDDRAGAALSLVAALLRA